MAYQNLFEAIERVTGHVSLEDDMREIIDAYKKDREAQNNLICNTCKRKMKIVCTTEYECNCHILNGR